MTSGMGQHGHSGTGSGMGSGVGTGSGMGSGTGQHSGSGMGTDSSNNSSGEHACCVLHVLLSTLSVVVVVPALSLCNLQHL